MKSYDDLQRFKEKTQTNHIEFKDMSAQSRDSDSTHWAIIKQLMHDGAESALGNGQRIDVPVPQRIAEDSLVALREQAGQPVEQQKWQHQPPMHAPSHGVAPLVAKPAAAQRSASLLESISASLNPQAVNPFNAEQTSLASAQQAFASSAAEQPRFKPLFSTEPEPSVASLSKDTLLQPLLERIASCR